MSVSRTRVYNCTILRRGDKQNWSQISYLSSFITRSTTNNTKSKSNSKASKSPKQKQTKQKQNNSRKQNTTVRRTAVVPVTQSYNIKNSTRNTTQVIRGSEYLTSWVIASTSAGRLVEIPLDPVNDYYDRLRIKLLASSFGKFRFRRARLTVGCNFATTISGNFLISYSENPQLQLASLTDSALFNQIYAMNGQSSPFWSPITYDAKIRDRSKWYNIDADSSNLMDSIQGKFILAIQTTPSAPLPVTIPILLDYEIELVDPAIQVPGPAFGTSLAKSNTTFTQRAEETRGQYHVSAGGDLPDNIIYKIVGGAQIITRDGIEEATWIVHYTNAALSHGFYRTFADACAAVNPVVSSIQVGGTFVIDNMTLLPTV